MIPNNNDNTSNTTTTTTTTNDSNDNNDTNNRLGDSSCSRACARRARASECSRSRYVYR